ncbi:MAG TPA: UDP-2,3-diacylglucosamine diphosphatase LpxI [Rhizomicrobium sp.]|nr:UDP-2,3-diacylglucosamine diphosphatase LpxI [Rhizomicrobium sp.]
MPRLGIMAGGGDLPIAIVESARKAGRDVFILRMPGADQDFGDAPQASVGIGEWGRTLSLLHGHHCETLTMAGKLPRPDWKSIKPDMKGLLVAPGVFKAALKGDDALLRHMIVLFEKDGFRVIGTAEAAPELIAGPGVYGRHKPDEQANEDLQQAFRIVRRMGELDIGQAAVVCEGLTLAVEAAEGTDAMLERLGQLPRHVRGTATARRGVMVKAPKPRQERRVDLPVIGVRTVELCAEAGLAGVAVQAGAALVVRKDRIVEAADRLGLFVMGVDNV